MTWINYIFEGIINEIIPKFSDEFAESQIYTGRAIRLDGRRRLDKDLIPT